jgi:copper chaperone
MEKAVIRVEGMSCGHCEIAVKDAVRKLAGVQKVKASRRKKQAAVEFDPALVSLGQIRAAIGETGYEVRD